MGEGHQEKDPVSHAILAAAFEVSNTLGHGFLEKVYQKALAHEFLLRGLACQREVAFTIRYKDAEIATYVADMVVEGAIIVELKCASRLADSHVSQCLNYLHASGLKTAMLLNFGNPKVEFKRIVV